MFLRFLKVILLYSLVFTVISYLLTERDFFLGLCVGELLLFTNLAILFWCARNIEAAGFLVPVVFFLKLPLLLGTMYLLLLRGQSSLIGAVVGYLVFVPAALHYTLLLSEKEDTPVELEPSNND